jgi:putative addiction module CopG family antidote
MALSHWHNLATLRAEPEVAVPTRNVVLTEQQSVLIERLVNSGRYQNASEVLRDGLRLVAQRESEDVARLVPCGRQPPLG